MTLYKYFLIELDFSSNVVGWMLTCAQVLIFMPLACHIFPKFASTVIKTTQDSFFFNVCFMPQAETETQSKTAS